MGLSGFANALKALIDVLGRQGAFAIGALFGALIVGFASWLSSGERKTMFKLIIEREKVLERQMDVKEKRINELHSELLKARKGK